MNTRGYILGIEQLNKLPSSDFKGYYLRSDTFALEKKSSSFLGKVIQWLTRICNPKIYKPEHVFKNLITYAAFNNLNTTAPKHRLDFKDTKFTDWAIRLEKADQNRSLLPEQNRTAIKIYKAAIKTLDIKLGDFLDANLGGKLKAPLKILLVALKAQGYDDEFCRKFLTLVGRDSKSSSFYELLQNLDNNLENVLHLFELIEDLAKAHKKAKLSPNDPRTQGYISKAFSPYLESHGETLRNDQLQLQYHFVDNYAFQTSLFNLLKSSNAPSIIRT